MSVQDNETVSSGQDLVGLLAMKSGKRGNNSTCSMSSFKKGGFRLKRFHGFLTPQDS